MAIILQFKRRKEVQQQPIVLHFRKQAVEDIRAWTGEYGVLEELVFLPFTVEGYSGELATVSFKANPQFQPHAFSIGEELPRSAWQHPKTVLVQDPNRSYAGTGWEAQQRIVWEGQNIVASLTRDNTLTPSVITVGEEVLGSHTINIDINSDGDRDVVWRSWLPLHKKTVVVSGRTAESGEYATVSRIDNLAFVRFAAQAGTGEVLSLTRLDSETLVTLRPQDAVSGERVDVSSFVSSSGKVLRYWLPLQTGETATLAAITNAPKPKPTGAEPIKVGEEASVSLQISRVFMFSSGQGEEGQKRIHGVGIDNASLLRVYSGEQTAVITMPGNAKLYPQVIHTSEDVVVDVKPRIGHTLDMRDIGTSEDTYITLERLKHVRLLPRKIFTGEWAFVEVENRGLNIALCKSCQAPYVGCTFHFDLGDYPLLWEGGGDVPVHVSVHLEVNKRWSAEAASGEYATVRFYEDSILPPMLAFTGEHSRRSVNLVYDKNTDFDNSSRIPDGEGVDSDLFEPEPIHKEGIGAWDGQELKPWFSAEQCFRANPLDGQEAKMELAFDPYWLPARIGEMVKMRLQTNVHIRPYDAVSGEDTPRWKFYEPPVEIFTGETATAKIITEYAVTFDEIGCVDNEYIPRKDNGELDRARATAAAIELEIFEYNIKGRCY